jgi:4-hydroxy-3-methylbut-2-en-1-yl diphosphate reductase
MHDRRTICHGPRNAPDVPYRSSQDQRTPRRVSVLSDSIVPRAFLACAFGGYSPVPSCWLAHERALWCFRSYFSFLLMVLEYGVPKPAILDGRPVRVILAQPRGFCAGVIRAIDIVEQALRKFGTPVYVRHEIVHNRHVVDNLRAKGARFVEDLSEVPAGAVTIFSAHGVARSVEDEARARALRVLDATCPLVAKVHGQGNRYFDQGRTVILVGHAGHPEVEGTMGQIPGRVLLVQTEADVEALDLTADTPVAYITQTTLSVDDTRNVIAALQRRFINIVGPDIDDICYATQNRQQAVRELAKLADIILVVGAGNSSNSNRLCEIGIEVGKPSYLIADGSELDPSWVSGAGVVGITAGASAPEELVEDVIAALRRLRPVEVSVLPGIEETVEFRIPADLLRGPRVTDPAV